MAGHEIESESVFSAIGSVSCFELWSFMLVNPEQTLFFSPFAQYGKSVEVFCFVLFVSLFSWQCLKFEKTRQYATSVMLRK